MSSSNAEEAKSAIEPTTIKSVNKKLKESLGKFDDHVSTIEERLSTIEKNFEGDQMSVRDRHKTQVKYL